MLMEEWPRISETILGLTFFESGSVAHVCGGNNLEAYYH